MQPSWHRFRIDHRDFEWAVSDGSPRKLEVRSVAGDYRVLCSIMDDPPHDVRNYIARSLVLAPTILGAEFPRGARVETIPVSLDGGFEIAEHGLIHTEFVRSWAGGKIGHGTNGRLHHPTLRRNAQLYWSGRT